MGILDFGFWSLGILDFGFCDKFWMLHKKRRLCTPNRVGGLMAEKPKKWMQQGNCATVFMSLGAAIYPICFFCIAISSNSRKSQQILYILCGAATWFQDVFNLMVQNGLPFVNLPRCDIAIPWNSSSLNDTRCSVRWTKNHRW